MRFIISILFLLTTNVFFSQNIILEEDFEQAVFPDAWSQATLSNDGGWLSGTNGDLQSDWWSIIPHGNFLATNDDECDCNKSEDYLILPALNFSEIDNAVLSFASFFSGENFQGSTDEATIEYSMDGGASWIVLSEIEGNGNSDNTIWVNQTVNLNELTGFSDVVIAFRYNDDGGWNRYRFSSSGRPGQHAAAAIQLPAARRASRASASRFVPHLASNMLLPA